MPDRRRSRKLLIHWLAPLILLTGSLSTAVHAQPNGLDARAIGRAAGVEATVKDNDVVRIGWSRDDVPVAVDGMPFPPAAGLGSWAAFKALPKGSVMVMGDSVVFEDEITPAMDAAFAHGLNVTALHNHFIFARPPVSYLHIGGHGQDGAELAKGVRAVWDAIKAVRAADPTPVNRFSGRVPDKTGEIDVAALRAILGTKPSVKDGVVRFSFGREAIMHNTTIGASMGIATWAAFTGNAEYAVVDGDFAMTAEEVQPVMHALRNAGIHVVALHNHMLGGDPFYYFLHYWGKGNPETLARGVRAVLDQVKVQNPL
ncbi:MAG: DUF1259 domain-containing protein [Nitrococcus mobilis]|nr:DUF1259 domain-containing protein [Nitrococcus mobilis]